MIEPRVGDDAARNNAQALQGCCMCLHPKHADLEIGGERNDVVRGGGCVGDGRMGLGMHGWEVVLAAWHHALGWRWRWRPLAYTPSHAPLIFDSTDPQANAKHQTGERQAGFARHKSAAGAYNRGACFVPAPCGRGATEGHSIRHSGRASSSSSQHDGGRRRRTAPGLGYVI